MVQRSELIAYLNDLLAVEHFSDYCPNGLQIEGCSEVQTLIAGVTASQAFLERALAEGADTVLVHHGYFWKGENPSIVGMKAQRIGALLRANANLLAYHLPLDAHPLYGNNRQLADRLGIAITGEVAAGPRPALVLKGRLAQPVTAEAFAAHIEAVLGRSPMHIEGGPGKIQEVAWCTGAGQDFIDAAAASGVDAYISGEISERTTHSAREQGIHYYAVGHHASERYGVQALGEHLAERFGLKYSFIDVDNPA
ncbi:Nif3-like dinuclear metal center hexameric protein [Alkalilimnicola ehrlichii]|uniref:Nif3-like dinuclear metal center hexameric protein n=1 Tax=Alkalilimnicola ehrlichii TaxID=351052 RepID=UPI000E2FDE29|nr:Nif3-like dinuclear metal center hexameric protein [Alkalilimnicola ehrlichii]RFA30300.1 Nif3-like dinuclear metal center hexameric protein [Alkalilimnicola ehrlichii]